MFFRRLLPLALLASLTACDQVAALLELPDPQKDAAMQEAEGKAIGGACRQTGRSVEDCYALNSKASKAAVFAGWREMNDYMIENNLQTVPSVFANPAPTPAPNASAAGAPASPQGETGTTAH